MPQLKKHLSHHWPWIAATVAAGIWASAQLYGKVEAADAKIKDNKMAIEELKEGVTEGAKTRGIILNKIENLEKGRERVEGKLDKVIDVLIQRGRGE